MVGKTVALGEFKESTEIALHYFRTLVEVARESFLILDKNLRVISANEKFYRNFGVTKEETELTLLVELGNGQWDIPELFNLLENILPKKKVIKDYEVTHTFETIGLKTILLNASQIDTVQLIVLALEDVTTHKLIEQQLADFANEQDIRVTERTIELASRVKELEVLNKAMVGRELKMMELKQEMIKLKKTCRDCVSPVET